MTKRGKIPCIIVAALTLAGVILITVRPLGMRFSGFLLVGLAAVLALELLLRRWAKASRRETPEFLSLASAPQITALTY